MPSGIAYVRTTRDYGHASECWDGAIIWWRACFRWTGLQGIRNQFPTKRMN
jgi:hypothetical protein